MKIISSESNNGKIHWKYFVPSTKYIVELKELSINENKINLEWTNRDTKGEIESGRDTFVRSNESGFINTGDHNDTKESGETNGDTSKIDMIE